MRPLVGRRPVRWVHPLLLALAAMWVLSGCGLLAEVSPDDHGLVQEPPPPEAHDSLAALQSTDAPARNAGLPVSQASSGQDQPAAFEKEGDVRSFWYTNLDKGKNELISAVLAYRTDRLNMWVEEKVRFSDGDLAQAAERIAADILPHAASVMGQETIPGIDGDPRLNVLHLKKIGGMGAAYFWSGDLYPVEVNRYSNEREMLYVSLSSAPIGSRSYFAAISHELQHLIQWHADANEDGWLNEGLAEAAAFAGGFTEGRSAQYAAATDIQLTALSHDPKRVGAHYAAAFQFLTYFQDRFGEDALIELTRRQENGSAGFDALLSEMGSVLDFNGLFSAWLVASYLDGIGRGTDPYTYQNLSPAPIEATKLQGLPLKRLDRVSQYGADYYRLAGKQPVTAVFTGTQQIPLIEARPHSGEYYVVSLPADGSDMRLSRSFDLTDMAQAALSFWAWYDIEDGWDYAYVAVSADGGLTWDQLETENSTRENPHGSSLGPGFTGISGGGRAPDWIQQTADLTDYAGRSIQIRFRYITDGAVHEQGFVVDDVSIAEIDYFEDFESGLGGWQAEGFARTGQMLPQIFSVQQILIGRSDVVVSSISLDPRQQGRWVVPLDDIYNEAILIISGRTPFTRQPATYTFSIHP